MFNLDELLEGINDSNVHDELSWGDSQGGEVW